VMSRANLHHDPSSSAPHPAPLKPLRKCAMSLHPPSLPGRGCGCPCTVESSLDRHAMSLRRPSRRMRPCPALKEPLRKTCAMSCDGCPRGQSESVHSRITR
jgi:hypothetical protein